VTKLVELLDENQREMFEERSAIRSEGAGYSREHGEALGLLDVINRYPEALSGVTVFAFEIDGATHFVVTTDEGLARTHAASKGGEIRGASSVASIVDQHFGGIATLAAVG